MCLCFMLMHLGVCKRYVWQLAAGIMLVWGCLLLNWLHCAMIMVDEGGSNPGSGAEQ